MDLTEFLGQWPYQPGRLNVRWQAGVDEREKIQVRLELGVLQMEADGRPDGLRPAGLESLLHVHLRTLTQTGALVLDSDACRALREEAILYYHRYVALFALGDHVRVVRDTTRNLELMALCRAHAATPDDRLALERMRPQVTMMRARSEAELAIEGGIPGDALEVIDRGLEELRRCFEELGTPDAFERSNEAQLLRGMRDILVPKLPASQRFELEERLRAALDAENYELAAILRDELRMMR